MLAEDWGVSADVWSVTSGPSCAATAWPPRKHNFLHPGREPRVPYVTQQARQAPPARSSPPRDYVSAVPDQIRQFLPNAFATLGADGHGFSDTRAAARRFFHIDATRSWSGRCRCSPRRGEVDANAPEDAAERTG